MIHSDTDRKHIYQTLIGIVLLFGFSILLSLAPFAMLSSLTSAVVVSCIHNQPHASLSQSDAHPATATSSYLLTITNRDTAACSSSVFDLQSDVPGQSIGFFSSDPVLLAPGATAQIKFTFLADTTLSPGTYPLTLIVQSLDQPTLSSSITFQQTIP